MIQIGSYNTHKPCCSRYAAACIHNALSGCILFAKNYFTASSKIKKVNPRALLHVRAIPLQVQQADLRIPLLLFALRPTPHNRKGLPPTGLALLRLLCVAQYSSSAQETEVSCEYHELAPPKAPIQKNLSLRSKHLEFPPIEHSLFQQCFPCRLP